MRRLVLFSLLALSLAGCDWKIKPSFQAKDVDSALKKMCAKEYRLSVETRVDGDTLRVFFWRVGLMNAARQGAPEGEEPGLRSEAAEALQRVLLCATRVSLSTDAPLKFIEVKMSDILSGATVTLWRYVPDIRDSMYTRLPEE